jgi:Rod binding domain-containing protein
MSQINKLPNLNLKNQTGNTAKYKNVPKPYLDVAKGMERQFIGHMIQQMQSTVKSENPDSSSTKYYKSLMDSERAGIMADTKNGIGLKDIILDQILPQHLKQQANAKDVVKMYQPQADSTKGELK